MNATGSDSPVDGAANALDDDALAELARRAFEAERYDEARQHLERIIQSGNARAADFYNLGQVHMAVEDFGGAIDAFTRAVDGSSDAVSARALAYERSGEIDLARADYAQVLRSTPDDVDTLTNLGTLELTAGNLEEARRLLERARSLDPTANWQYADVLLELGRRGEAREALEDAIAAGENRAYLDLAELDAEDGDVRSAEKHFLLAVESGATLARSAYAFYLLDQEDLDRARQFAQAAVDDGDGWSLRPLATAYQQLGEDAQAEHFFAAADDFGDTIDD